MQKSDSTSRFSSGVKIQMRKIFVLLIFGFSIIQGLVVYLTELLGSNSPYQLSEWLINYEAGFIRRGFSGSLYLAFFPSGQNGLYVLAFLLFLITLIPQYVTLIWLEKVGFNWSCIAITCSPAFLVFAGWDIGAFGRKEWIAYSAISLLLFTRLKPLNEFHFRFTCVSASLLFLVGVLCWEPTFLLIPLFLTLLYRPLDESKKLFCRYLSVLTLASCSVAFLASVLSSTRENASSYMCAAIREKGIQADEVCAQALFWLSKSSFYAIKATFSVLDQNSVYLPLLLLSLLPIVTIVNKRIVSRKIALLLPLVILFIIGQDYGRWINILVTATTFLIMSSSKFDFGNKSWTSISTILYTTMWALPHAAHNDRFENGGIGLFSRLINIFL